MPTLANGGVKTNGCADTAAAMCVTWHLRPGVRWDDGSDLTSHDVCDTFALHWLAYGALGKPSPTPLASTTGWNQVIKCSEPDQNTAVVDFKSQYGPYLALGSGVDGILPAAVLDPVLAAHGDLESSPASLDLTTGSGNPAAFKGTATLATALDGTGPFVMSSYTPGSQLMLVRNPDYWNQIRRWPISTRSSFRIEPDLATEVKDVRSGAVEVGLESRALGAGIAGRGRPRAHRSLHGRSREGLGCRSAPLQPLPEQRRVVREPCGAGERGHRERDRPQGDPARHRPAGDHQGGGARAHHGSRRTRG